MPAVVDEPKLAPVVSIETGVDVEATKGAKAKPFKIDWGFLVLLAVMPTLAFYGFLTTHVHLYTVLFSVFYYFFAGMGITMGYHRLWSHRTYSATWPVRFVLCAGGTAALEGTVFKWSVSHRAHHRFVDTELDPYNVRLGFWWAHFGWMLVTRPDQPDGLKYCSIRDLEADPMLRFQDKYYALLAPLLALVVPTVVPGLLWGDYRGGFFFAGIARAVFIHHSTFFINSLAHWAGERTYSEQQSAADCWVTALLALGEGYHNFHHEFPQDYRNGIRWFHYDPTKWLIKACSWVGLTHDLHQIPEGEINKARVQTQKAILERRRRQLAYGKQYDMLPALTSEQVARRVAEGEHLVIVDGLVHDVTGMIDDHPGGRLTLLRYIGRDITPLFYGALDSGETDESELASEESNVDATGATTTTTMTTLTEAEKLAASSPPPPHFHSQIARDALPTMRVGRLCDAWQANKTD